MRQKVNIITLGVKDLKISTDFYKDIIGWQPSPASQESVTFFNLGGMILSLFQIESLAEDAKVRHNREGFSGFTLAYNAKSESEVDEVLTSLEKKGVIIAKKAEKVFWGGYSGYFQDPDEYLWEVAFNPFFEFDENDNLKI